ncbi:MULTISPECIES: hypothetical protein [unclassified Breznakia]|uniref:DUF7674 family protein n=1 Tax=unclassified Breznakia TaxID=2623764 RepID=UPI0024730CD9|nr:MULTISPECIES: hypothetical protein [unclassified Breznakia]MDH6366686.1 aromatic ring-opening dioxygenase LigB subunit [Breznakia sp. PH1-1]MDH6403779.1 aromatic ring-opening dioxygenase LigB subunit [Breznakia sp. PF1-11]MDH6411488.1 aromatic ring-opening dioxygenase LigB subunit [Breznakia sp. PFB1-11]MDH6413781.1 aromatic ring-opening dioxygenase LigB subunit [Breznakia sp. PFB1-14]MDH6416211.1 aromatic ring-opening dioxygenase LigB subunit [Breznakia sp. PFB1-4]
MYDYKNAIEILIENIPEMKVKYENDRDYYEGLPYVFYETEFEKFIVNQIKNENIEMLKKIFTFIENMLEKGDKEIKSLIEVSIIESLTYEQSFKLFFKYVEECFGILTKQSFNRIKNI